MVNLRERTIGKGEWKMLMNSIMIGVMIGSFVVVVAVVVLFFVLVCFFVFGGLLANIRGERIGVGGGGGRGGGD